MLTGKGDGKKFVCLPTQCYDVPSSQVGGEGAIIVAELDGKGCWKRNMKHVIIFQTFILQRIQLITGKKSIRG